jgi:hypothetical protein
MPLFSSTKGPQGQQLEDPRISRLQTVENDIYNDSDPVIHRITQAGAEKT